MLITSTMSCPYHLALAYDELASVFSARSRSNSNSGRKNRIDKYFLAWICDQMTIYFETNFVMDTISIKIPQLEFSFLYVLNTQAELESDSHEGKVLIGIDVAGGVVKKSSK